ncbi:hypothetical protein A0H81_11065 [Grifola frondosa]|uniref:Uncharacterized protein n=1 Tax=Grifola frondosa TaxID=5627 RepID=A0A1C7LVU4_GRIFR|nr:hypothetical protein A0H81_11065 [Grifola frondosa]
MFEKAFNTAFRDGASEQDLDLFVQHAILVCRTSYHKRGRMPSVKILKSLKKRRCISKAQVLSLLQTLQDTDQLRFVDHDDRVNIVRAITNYPPDDELDGPLYELLSQLLTEMLSKHEAPPKDPASPLQEGEDIPAFLWPLFVIVRRLALLGRQQVASDTFSALVKRKYIHPEAIRRTDLKSRDFSYIVLSTLVRTCMLWGWFQRASFLLIPALAAAKDISRPFGELAAHWAYALLEVPSDPDLTNCASVLIQLMNYAPTYRLPDTLLQEFYAAAQRARAPELAQAVYAAARADAVVARHPYLPPRGPPLLWLMQHLQESAKNVHLARVLAKHVVDENAPVSLHARAPFVAAVAQLGFATQARALWERYAAGVNAVVVVGNAATMLRLVSLFTHMAQRAEWALAHPHPNLSVELPAGAVRRNSVRREEPGDHVEGLGADRDAAAAGYPASDAPGPTRGCGAANVVGF